MSAGKSEGLLRSLVKTFQRVTKFNWEIEKNLVDLGPKEYRFPSPASPAVSPNVPRQGDEFQYFIRYHSRNAHRSRLEATDLSMYASESKSALPPTPNKFWRSK